MQMQQGGYNPGQFGAMPFGAGASPLMGGLPPLGEGASQTMPPVNGPAQISFAELRMKPAEGQLYDALFRECDPQQTGFITGAAIKSLFTRSKLSKTILAGIWTLADKGRRKALDRENWAVAMRLVSLAQNGLPVSELGLKQYVDVPLPQFEAFRPSAAAPQLMASSSAPLEHSSFSSAPVAGALAPAVASAPANGALDWSMSADERAQYLGLFGQADEDQDGFVNSKEAKFFKQSGLDNKALKQVWLLADQDKDNKLSPDEFNVAMHLALRVRKGMILPTVLPDVLVIRKSGSFSAPSSSFSSSMVDFAAAPRKASSGFDDFGAPSLSSSSASSNMMIDGPGLPSLSSASSAPAFAPSSVSAAHAPISSAPVQPTNFFPGGSPAAFLQAPGDEQDKWRELSRTLSTAQSSVSHQTDVLKGLSDTLALFNAKTRLLVEQVAKTGQDHAHLQQLITEEQAKIEGKKNELANLDVDNNGILSKIEAARQELEMKRQELRDTQQKIIDAHTSIPSIKKETQEAEMQIAITESQLQQIRQAWKQIEDTKNTQNSILAARKDQAAKLLREKQEVQEMLDQSQLDLSKIKNEASVVRDTISSLPAQINEMKSDLKELQEVVAEEKKNPTARAQVSIDESGKLQLGAARPPPPPAKAASAAVPSNKFAAASLGFDDEENDFAVPDFHVPNAMASPLAAVAKSQPPPPMVKAPSKVVSAFDDDDDFSIPDISLPSLGVPFASPSAPVAHVTAAPAAVAVATSRSSFAFDDADDFAVPDIQLPSLGAPSMSKPPSFVKAPSIVTATVKPVVASSSFDDFGGDFGSSAALAAHKNGSSDPFGSDWSADPLASAAPAKAAISVNTSSSFDDFGADPFASSTSSFGASSPNAPTPPTLVSPKAASPPPPPPSKLATSPKPPMGRIPSIPQSALPIVAPVVAPVKSAMASFEDDGDWTVPDGVPGGDQVAVNDWSKQQAADTNDWGF